ncbi:kinase-like protein [Rhizoclosmatium globosum]|uniref:Casein kinase II subunit alpha n=1 Tax=Rhizoclosmatium globosum TaxID=329046 RepID=A0A1Y2C557_9FUNG|nr:kinase-like protein [Rhizoclosmatium globosum]|eukprot:ORY42017.1 kinase-like protein [Rhizoclosmatium globosum]
MPNHHHHHSKPPPPSLAQLTTTTTHIDRRTSRIYSDVVDRMGPMYSDWASTELYFSPSNHFRRGEHVLGKGKYSVVYDCDALVVLPVSQSQTQSQSTAKKTLSSWALSLYAMTLSSATASATTSTASTSDAASTATATQPHTLRESGAAILSSLSESWARLFPPVEGVQGESGEEQDENHVVASPGTPRQASILGALSQLSLYASSAVSGHTTPTATPSPSRQHPPSSSDIPLPLQLSSSSTRKLSSSSSIPSSPSPLPSTSKKPAKPAPPTPKKQYVMKLFRPDKTAKLKREILILKHLADGPNIVQFVDCILDPQSGSPGVVLERCGNVEWREFYASMGYDDIRFWMAELIKALAYTHQHGIIHRDVKPQNICMDPITRRLTLIDYGLADFYVPNHELNLRVASRFYKPPEILVGNRYYDYSFDMWSVG